MRKRNNTPKLVAISTIDGTHFVFPQPKELVERDQRKTAFFRKKEIFR